MVSLFKLTTSSPGDNAIAVTIFKPLVCFLASHTHKKTKKLKNKNAKSFFICQRRHILHWRHSYVYKNLQQNVTLPDNNKNDSHKIFLISGSSFIENETKSNKRQKQNKKELGGTANASSEIQFSVPWIWLAMILESIGLLLNCEVNLWCDGRRLTREAVSKTQWPRAVCARTFSVIPRNIVTSPLLAPPGHVQSTLGNDRWQCSQRLARDVAVVWFHLLIF